MIRQECQIDQQETIDNFCQKIKLFKKITRDNVYFIRYVMNSSSINQSFKIWVSRRNGNGQLQLMNALGVNIMLNKHFSRIGSQISDIYKWLKNCGMIIQQLQQCSEYRLIMTNKDIQIVLNLKKSILNTNQRIEYMLDQQKLQKQCINQQKQVKVPNRDINITSDKDQLLRKIQQFEHTLNSQVHYLQKQINNINQIIQQRVPSQINQQNGRQRSVLVNRMESSIKNRNQWEYAHKIMELQIEKLNQRTNQLQQRIVECEHKQLNHQQILQQTSQQLQDKISPIVKRSQQLITANILQIMNQCTQQLNRKYDRMDNILKKASIKKQQSKKFRENNIIQIENQRQQSKMSASSSSQIQLDRKISRKVQEKPQKIQRLINVHQIYQEQRYNYPYQNYQKPKRQMYIPQQNQINIFEPEMHLPHSQLFLIDKNYNIQYLQELEEFGFTALYHKYQVQGNFSMSFQVKFTKNRFIYIGLMPIKTYRQQSQNFQNLKINNSIFCYLFNGKIWYRNNWTSQKGQIGISNGDTITIQKKGGTIYWKNSQKIINEVSDQYIEEYHNKWRPFIGLKSKGDVLQIC